MEGTEDHGDLLTFDVNAGGSEVGDHVEETVVLFVQVTAGHDPVSAVAFGDIWRIIIERIAAQRKVRHVRRQRDDDSLTP